MDECTPLCAGRWQLTFAPKSFVPSILSFVGKLANDSHLLVLDGDNQFNALEVAEAVQGDEEILKRIRVSSAFTCYQLASVLESISATNTSILLLGFLSTFYDESAPFSDRSRLLETCLKNIRRLSRTNGLLVIAHPPAVSSPKATNLLKRLEIAAGEILPLEILTRNSESIGDDMGRKIPSFAQVFDQIQNSFAKFRRGIRLSDQLAFDALFAKARKHISASSLAARSLPFETILFCMILEQQKEITLLREQVNKQKTNQE